MFQPVLENAITLLRMARDLAIPPVAVQPANSGGGNTGEHHQDVHVAPPSPDEESDDLDDDEEVEEAEEGEVLYRQFLARRMAEERLMDNGIGSMDVRRRGRRRTEIDGQTTPRRAHVREEFVDQGIGDAGGHIDKEN